MQIYLQYSNELQRDFDKENKFQTSMRGIKITGVYSITTQKKGLKKLQRMDDTFHVFVGDVGELPWDPCADNVENEVFSDTALKDLIDFIKKIVLIKIFFMKIKL